MTPHNLMAGMLTLAYERSNGARKYGAGVNLTLPSVQIKARKNCIGHMRVAESSRLRKK